MRKWIIGLIVVLLVLMACAYALIPARMVVSESVTLNSNPYSAFRCLTSAGMVRQWWKDKSPTVAVAGKNGVTVNSGDAAFTLHPQMYNVVTVDIEKKDGLFNSFITLLPLQKDSMLVQWKAELPAAGLFLGRIQEYWRAKQLKKQMSAVLNQLAHFMSNSEQVYGLNVQQTRVTDTLLVVTKMSSAAYPAPAAYYGLIQKLQQYVAQQGAQETNFPMLHIAAVDSGRFETMVAIPVNKSLPPAGDILFKRMIPGKILTTEIKGGPQAIEAGLRQMDLYIAENELSQPAIPFQSLVTNRSAEKDTSRWVTKLYYPVL